MEFLYLKPKQGDEGVKHCSSRVLSKAPSPAEMVLNTVFMLLHAELVILVGKYTLIN